MTIAYDEIADNLSSVSYLNAVVRLQRIDLPKQATRDF